MNHRLLVWIEIDETQNLAGTLEPQPGGGACFVYDREFLQSPMAHSISVSLPLQEEPFSVSRTAAFFEGLLPEGFTRRSVAGWLRVDENDYLSILHALGQECLGAIRILAEEDHSPSASYEPLSLEQVHALAREGATKSAEIVTKSHLSLTGASGKVGLYRRDGVWYQPKGPAASTHILKQSHVRLDSIVLNEHLCLMTAKQLLKDVAESFIVDLGDGEDDNVLFASRRYDRILGDSCPLISGMPVPMRLHQEDFSQAMGIPASKKYEQPGENYLREMFRVIRENSSNPIDDTMKLWDMTVFDFLIGNTDNHIKNHSLLYGPNLQAIHMAPAYDILCTAIYETSTSDMAFHIGGKYSIEEITRADFQAAAEECGISRKMALNRFDRLADSFEKALEEAVRQLSEAGLTKAADLGERIRKNCGYSHLLL